MNPKGKAVIFSAPSGAGKTTIVRALLASDLPLQFSVSATSRAPRGEENHGKDYYFVGINSFKDSVDKDGFLEWEEVYPNQFYGTLKSEIDRIWESGNAVIFDVDEYGGIALKEKFGSKALSVFVMPPSVEALEARLRFRQTESEEKIQMRLSKANEELAMDSEFDFKLINTEVDIAVNNAKQRISAFLSDE